MSIINNMNSQLANYHSHHDHRLMETSGFHLKSIGHQRETFGNLSVSLHSSPSTSSSITPSSTPGESASLITNNQCKKVIEIFYLYCYYLYVIASESPVSLSSD